ncbi:hypothetical protein [Nocardia sp. CC201C]|uniref:hypothetical protein n=1 Tax=Nocardia sp. CC201C TaxID=3044575 RepID=UPI0024A8F9D8|nr:hypothetical protein [Nocardia sp. CC201C]
MKSFEHIADGETSAASVFIQPYRERLWAAAFSVDTLEGLFDMTPADSALAILDAAIGRFNAMPDELRAYLAAEDTLGLRGNRGLLLSLRNRLAKLGGTISGAVDESSTPS